MMMRRLLGLLCAVVLVVSACSSTDGTATRSPESSAVPEPVPTIVVLDASESMQKTDAPGERWTAATRAVDALVGGLPAGTDFGVVVFGADKSARRVSRAQGCTDVKVAVPSGPIDAAAVRRTLSAVTPQGFTPIGTALQKAAEQLPTSGRASVVLVSDGESTCAPDPCETAKRIRADHPETTISAVGFRTDAQTLQCVAREGGGVFLTAENAAQLSARLAAAQNSEVVSGRLTASSFGKISLGQTLDEVRAAEPSFPTEGATQGERLVIVWRDCTYVFDGDRTLVEIAPGEPAGSAGVTVDGVAKGTPGARAVDLYGEPVSDADGSAVFVADRGAGAGYRMGYDGGSTVSEGIVQTVVLCHCLPPERSDRPEPVLGRDGFDSWAAGFGTVRPTGFSIASTAASSVGDVTWESWGGAEAIGHGLSQQNGAGEPRTVQWLLASDLGWCDGTLTYRGLQRSPSRSTLRTSEEVRDICKASRAEPSSPTSGEEVTLTPNSVLTFGGAGGVHVGDSASKIPDTYLRRTVIDGPGMYPAGTVFYAFKDVDDFDPSERRITVSPSGRIESFYWDRSDRGISAGTSTLSDVEAAYRGVPSGRCSLSSAGWYGLFFTDPRSGRIILYVIGSQDQVARVIAYRDIEADNHCPFE